MVRAHLKSLMDVTAKQDFTISIPVADVSVYVDVGKEVVVV